MVIPVEIELLCRALACPAPEGGGVVTGVSIDSRSVRRGDCFVALSGSRTTGARFIDDAFARGAVLAVAGFEAPSAARVLRVSDPLAGLARLAGMVRERYDGEVVAITGSVGKTSVKEFLRQLVPSRLATVVPERSFNNLEGVSRTLARIEEGTRLAVLELGTNAPGEIAALAALVRPTVGVLTAIGAAHLEGLGSIEGVTREKLALADALPAGAGLFVNGDDPILAGTAYRPDLDLRRVGLDPRPGHIAPGGGDGEGVLRLDDGTAIRHHLRQRHQVRNLWIALQVARSLGVTPEELVAGAAGVRPAPLRGETRRHRAATLILDCYNANPLSMRAALDALAAVPGERAAVLGEMRELGPGASAHHRELGRWLGRCGLRAILFVGAGGIDVRAGFEEAGGAPTQLELFGDVAAARPAFERLTTEGGTILVKASRLVALERLVEGGHE